MDTDKTKLPIAHHYIEPQTDAAFAVLQDQHIRVIDAKGEQVADLTVFNIFITTALSANGSVAVETPLSRAGEYTELQARMDQIIGVTACSAGKCNNFQCTATDVEVW